MTGRNWVAAVVVWTTAAVATAARSEAFRLALERARRPARLGHRLSLSTLLDLATFGDEASRRRLYDVAELTARDDASILNGTCECPFAPSECPTATIYNNSMLYKPDDKDEAMYLLQKNPLTLDVSTAGDENCQELDGIELCQGNSTCVPDNDYLIYSCEKLTETLIGIGAARADELASYTDDELLDLTSSLTDGAYTGTDDAFGDLSAATILLYALLEQTGYYSCSDGCNLYDECAELCADTADRNLVGVAEATIAAADDCNGTVPFLTPTAAPVAAPTAVPFGLPTAAPFGLPTAAPFDAPTAAPFDAPTAAPAVAVPSGAPTATPEIVLPVSSSKKKSSNGLNSGAIAGIVIAAVVVFLCCIFLICFFVRRNRDDEDDAEKDFRTDSFDDPPMPGMATINEDAEVEAPAAVYVDAAAEPKEISQNTIVGSSTDQSSASVSAKIDEADL